MRRGSPVKTHGLTHVALAVRDPQRSLHFYQAVLGVIPVYQQGDFVQAQTPGSRDVLVFERKPRQAGKAGGVIHFGFRLRRAADIIQALAAIRAAGGTIRDHVTLRRRPFIRFFACKEDLSFKSAETRLPDPVVTGAEPLFIIGAMAGG